jgi:hypothetical protein
LGVLRARVDQRRDDRRGLPPFEKWAVSLPDVRELIED